MKGKFLIGSHEEPAAGNIYADKSALVLDWLLREGVKKEEFSLREVAKEIKVSIGLIQRVFRILVWKGLLQTTGIRTAKKFCFRKSKLLLESWLKHYSITQKCKMKTYSSALQGREDLVNVLKKSKLRQKIVLALHSASEVHGCKNTNLDTLEIYLPDPSIKSKLEEVLQLEPRERGYEVLLIEPYYKSLLKNSLETKKDIAASSILLTFLDLYHFPLRGQEQAEFMAVRLPEIRMMLQNGASQ